jgi:hypothetical protein
MIQAVQYCKCKKQLKSIHLIVKHNKNHSTIVNLPMCDKCRIIEITREQLKEWFGVKYGK